MVGTMEGSVVHHKYGFWLWPPATVLEKLLNEGFTECSIGGASENTRQDNAILCIGW
jgi:hypothetical protein